MKQLSLLLSLALFLVFGHADAFAQHASSKRKVVAKRNITALQKADVKQTRSFEQAVKVRYSDDVQLKASNRKAKCGSSDPRIKGRYSCNDVQKVMRERRLQKAAETNARKARLAKLRANSTQQVRQQPSTSSTARKIARPSSVIAKKQLPTHSRKAIKTSEAKF